MLNISTAYSSAHAQVLMLHRVPESSLDGMPPFNSLASNIYSSRELQLISWLNLHYQNMRGIMWGTGRTHNVSFLGLKGLFMLSSFTICKDMQGWHNVGAKHANLQCVNN